MSILLRPEIRPDKASMLTLVMALSVAEGIGQCMSQSECPALQIKWPNDIIINGKKLAGILTEMSSQIDYINHVTIGVGINVNLTDFPEEIAQTATSLRIECGHTVKRAPLIAAVMERLEENYDIFLKTEDLSGMTSDTVPCWLILIVMFRLSEQKKHIRLHAIGIGRTGELIVRRKDSTVEKIYAGEVSVRGVYGYV